MRRDTLKKVMLGALFVGIGLLAMVVSSPESSAFDGRVQHAGVAGRASFGSMAESSASSFAAPAMAMEQAMPMAASAPMMMKRSAPMANGGGGGVGIAGMSDMARGMDSLRDGSDAGGADAPLFGQPVILKEAFVTGEVQVRWRFTRSRKHARSQPPRGSGES